MHRDPLLTMLDQYAGRFVDEQPIVERVRSLVCKNADCFERSCRPGHVTGSAWVLSADRRRCLLVHHKKLGIWVQPGGHADGDPDILAVSLREATEESGLTNLVHVGDTELPLPLDLDIHRIPARHNDAGQIIEDAHEHHDVRFLFAAASESPIVVSAESHDVRWFTPDEIRELTDEPSVLRMLDKSNPWMR